MAGVPNRNRFFNKNWILKFAYKLEYKIYHAADNIIINSKGFILIFPL